MFVVDHKNNLIKTPKTNDSILNAIFSPIFGGSSFFDWSFVMNLIDYKICRHEYNAIGNTRTIEPHSYLLHLWKCDRSLMLTRHTKALWLMFKLTKDDSRRHRVRAVRINHTFKSNIFFFFFWIASTM